MMDSNSIPQMQNLGRFVKFVINPASFLAFVSNNKSAHYSSHEEEGKQMPPAEDFPLPDKEEIKPNPDVPEEEEYLPDEQEVPIEDPPKEIQDPYFPRKGDGLPPEKEDEFPKTDPI